MKKLILILFLAVWVMGADSTAVISSGITAGKLSGDVVRYELFDGSEDTGDTIAAGDFLIIGPYPLSKGGGQPQFEYFNLVGEGIGSADTAAWGFQITHSSSILDTNTRWEQFDSTDAASGPAQTVVDISQKSGNWIWYRVWNITTSAINMYSNQYAYFRKRWASD